LTPKISDDILFRRTEIIADYEISCMGRTVWPALSSKLQSYLSEAPLRSDERPGHLQSKRRCTDYPGISARSCRCDDKVLAANLLI